MKLQCFHRQGIGETVPSGATAGLGVKHGYTGTNQGAFSLESPHRRVLKRLFSAPVTSMIVRRETAQPLTRQGIGGFKLT